jgi:hypothetical protein
MFDFVCTVSIMDHIEKGSYDNVEGRSKSEKILRVKLTGSRGFWKDASRSTLKACTRRNVNKRGQLNPRDDTARHAET